MVVIRKYASLVALVLLAGCQPPGILNNVPETPSPVYRWGVETDGDTTAVLGWSDWTSGEVAYVVQTQEADGTWTPSNCEPVPSSSGTGTPLLAVVEGLTGETDYVFRVIAVGTSFASASVPIEVTTGPLTPVSFTAVYNAPNVDIAWMDVASTESSYLVQRSTNGEYFISIAALPAGTESYQNTSVATGVYYYRVYAEGSVSNSGAPVVGPVVVP